MGDRERQLNEEHAGDVVGTEIVPEERKGELETADFLAMDLADEEQLKEVMKGRIVTEWVYEVKGNYQLTAVGIFESALMYARQKQKGIDVGEPHETYSADGQEVRIWIKATDLNTGASAIGAKAGPVGKEFWYESTISKAQRNAIRHLLPVSFITSIIEAAVVQGKVKHLPGGKSVPTVALPARPPVPKIAKGQRDPFEGLAEEGKVDFDSLPKLKAGEQPTLTKLPKVDFETLRYKQWFTFVCNGVEAFANQPGSTGKPLARATAMTYWLAERGYRTYWKNMELEELKAAWRELKQAFPEVCAKAEEGSE